MMTRSRARAQELAEAPRAPAEKRKADSKAQAAEPGPVRRAEAGQTPSAQRSVHIATATAQPNWTLALEKFLAFATAGHQPAATPGHRPAAAAPGEPSDAVGWRQWRETLTGLLPQIERDLTAGRPPAVDTAPTDLEQRALALICTLTSLRRRLPGVLAPAEQQAWSRLKDDARARVARAGALPNTDLASIPALHAAARAGLDTGDGVLRGQVLGLRLGGAAMRPERRDLVLTQWAAQHGDFQGDDRTALSGRFEGFLQAGMYFAPNAASRSGFATATFQQALAGCNADPTNPFAGDIGRAVSTAFAAYRTERLRDVIHARTPQAEPLRDEVVANCVIGLCWQPTPEAAAAHLAEALAHLSLGEAAAILRTLSRAPIPEAGTLANAFRWHLAQATPAREPATTARLALAWGLANTDRGQPWLQAQFPAAALANGHTNLCRVACLAALRPSKLLACPALSTADRLSLLHELHRDAMPLIDVDAAVHGYGTTSSPSQPLEMRAARSHLICDLLQRAPVVSMQSFLTAHAFLLRDLHILLTHPGADALGEAAVADVQRAYECIAQKALLSATTAPLPEPRATMVRSLLPKLEEVRADLQQAEPLLREHVLPTIEALLEQLNALTPAVQYPGVPH